MTAGCDNGCMEDLRACDFERERGVQEEEYLCVGDFEDASFEFPLVTSRFAAW